MAHLRAGASDFDTFFDPDSRYIDAAGNRWFGEQSVATNLKELFAPFAAPEARYEQEHLIERFDGLCVATLLWHAVPASSAARSLRMNIVLAPAPSKRFAWRVHSIQLTPVL